MSWYAKPWAEMLALKLESPEALPSNLRGALLRRHAVFLANAFIEGVLEDPEVVGARPGSKIELPLFNRPSSTTTQADASFPPTDLRYRRTLTSATMRARSA